MAWSGEKSAAAAGGPDPDGARACSVLRQEGYRLMAELLYGSGLRLMECLRLRVEDLRFWLSADHRAGGKGQKTVTMLPVGLRRRCAGTWRGCAGAMRRIWRRASAGCGSRSWATTSRLAEVIGHDAANGVFNYYVNEGGWKLTG